MKTEIEVGCPECGGSGELNYGLYCDCTAGYRALRRECGFPRRYDKYMGDDAWNLAPDALDGKLAGIMGAKLMVRHLGESFPLTEIDPTLSPSLRNGMVILGKHGFGKTCLACWVGNQFLHHDKKVQFIFTPKWLKQLKNLRFEKHDQYQKMLEDAYSADLLIMDELALPDYRTPDTGELLDLVTERYNMDLPIIATTNAQTIEDLDSALTSQVVVKLQEISHFLVMGGEVQLRSMSEIVTI